MKMDKHEKIKSKLMGKNTSGGLTSGKIIKSDQLYFNLFQSFLARLCFIFGLTKNELYSLKRRIGFEICRLGRRLAVN